MIKAKIKDDLLKDLNEQVVYPNRSVNKQVKKTSRKGFMMQAWVTERKCECVGDDVDL